jgi:hypothetical protein
VTTNGAIVVRCSTCGPVAVDGALVELHRDRRWGFTLATFLCCGCGEVGASRCPTAIADLERAAAPERPLTCTSPPSVPDPVV